MAAADTINDPLDIRAAEHGTLRVFDVNLPEPLAMKLAELPFERDSALGVTLQDAGRTEMFDVASLGDLGLAGYLSEGMGIAEEEIAPHRAALGNIAGYALLLRAGAVGGPARLAPIEGLRLVAMLREERPQLSFEKIYSSGSDGILTPPPAAHAAPPTRSLRALLGILFLAALVVGAVVWSLL